MAVTLEIKTGPFAGKRVEVSRGQTILVGRSTTRSDFAVPHDNFLSSLHFALEYGPDGCLIADRNSANGTFVNGVRVTRAKLKNDDEVRVGQTTFVVRIDDEQTAASVASPAPVSAKGPQGLLLSDPAAGISTGTSVPATAAIVGSWRFEKVPEGWEIQEDYGVRKNAKDKFPSNLVATAGSLPANTTLKQFAEAQLHNLCQYWQQPQIEAVPSASIRGAEETVAFGARHTPKGGQEIIHRSIWARRAGVVGTLTLTTMACDLSQDLAAFETILSGLAFDPT